MLFQRMLSGLALATSIASFTAILAPSTAEACGCFAPTTVGEPVVQAGERIVFAHEDGKVVAHIQIQYAGEADDFAWLVPMPAIPDMKVGTEELFSKLQETTGPQFVLVGSNGDGCNSGIGCGDFALSSVADRGPNMMMAGVAVKESSAGPYDFAVVRADEKQPMLDWLADNSYFVPAGTQEAIDPYIRPGAYFLALKLRAGQTVGDLQPVIVEYASERPMIPIILTSVAANPDMGIQVWVLGDSRAIPHNYQHVLINEAYINWRDGASNYASVVGRAVDETDDHHAFVTEYAGGTELMRNVLAGNGRFGARGGLEATTDPRAYVSELQSRGFWPLGLIPIMRREFDIPEDALDLDPGIQGFIDEGRYFQVFSTYAAQRETPFDPIAVTADIWERIVEPSEAANRLFTDNSYMTRMFTTLDPDEMTEDPVFAFNPDLPPVSNVHTAERIIHCNGKPDELHLADGRYFEADDQGVFTTVKPEIPFSARVEILRQEGQPEIVVDNYALLAESDDLEDGGCIGSGRTRRGGYGWALFFGLLLVGRRFVRRRS